MANEEEPKYSNECYSCGYNWLSWNDSEHCPECGEWDNVGTNPIED
jgi:predicted RNA-binding Zn-ribbon protein involved in translation (DUF1610 family)